MQRKLLSAFAALLLCSAVSSYSQESSGGNIKFTPGARIGYNRGLGIQANVTAANFTPEFPFKIRLGAGLTFINPGDAPDARRIFINNNTNGTPEKKGRSIDIRLDFLVARTVFGLENSYLSAGPRFSAFKGNFKYIGGNEDFDVKSHQWGIGAGIENHFKMTPAMYLVISYGLDFYVPSTLTGHDTSYSPDNDNVNPRTDNQNDNVYFIYKDANKAVRQPVFMPFIMLGLSF